MHLAELGWVIGRSSTAKLFGRATHGAMIGRRSTADNLLPVTLRLASPYPLQNPAGRSVLFGLALPTASPAGGFRLCDLLLASVVHMWWDAFLRRKRPKNTQRRWQTKQLEQQARADDDRERVKIPVSADHTMICKDNRKGYSPRFLQDDTLGLHILYTPRDEEHADLEYVLPVPAFANAVLARRGPSQSEQC
jgi:hypothetical protein